jgi:hypothetical protein
MWVCMQESAMSQSTDQELFRICYSCHCSYRELEFFIKYLKPRQIEACVVPRNMEEAHVLQLLREVSGMESGCMDPPLLTVSNRRGTRDGMSGDVTTAYSSQRTEQQNTITPQNETNIKEAGHCNIQNEEGYVDSEIYRLHTEQQNTITLQNETNIKEECQCNMQNEEGYVDSEIYRLIAEDLKPKIGDQDVNIRHRMSQAFLNAAVALKKPVVRESC